MHQGTIAQDQAQHVTISFRTLGAQEQVSDIKASARDLAGVLDEGQQQNLGVLRAWGA